MYLKRQKCTENHNFKNSRNYRLISKKNVN